MSLIDLGVDLFGFPVAMPVNIPAQTKPPVAKRAVSEEARIEARRAKLRRHLEASNNLVLFDELLEFLKAPLLNSIELPNEYASDVAKVAVVEEEEEVDLAASVRIPYEAWGDVWVEDSNGHKWSKEGLLFTQNRLFWRSLEELALSYNEQEKWSVLRWIFRPAIWKYYVYDKRVGHSHCLQVHERDETFSFHNCCIAARMDPDIVREGVRRNIPAVVVKSVERVCSFN